jgi:trimeric autotransporter adhesin
MFTLTAGRLRRIAGGAGLATLVAAGLATASGAVASPMPSAPNLSSSDVATAWQFPVAHWTLSNKEQGRVDDILRLGNVVYIAGNFTTASNHSGQTVTRTYLAAEDATTGALLPWAPKLNGRVYFLAASPDHKTLYAGGEFTTVNGAAVSHLAAFDTATGNLSPVVPNLKINGTVKAIAASGSDLYIGGAFTSVSGQPRVRLAKLTQGGPGIFALNPSWKPTASDEVRDMIADPANGRVIVAGWFKTIDGLSSQGHLASLSMTTGAPLAWASHPKYEILDITRSGNDLYAAMGGPGGAALAFDMSTGQQLWYYMTDGNVQAVTTVGGYPIYGMHGDNVAPKKDCPMSEYGHSARVPRHKIFELSPQGDLQPWAPDLTSNAGVLGVWALKSGGGSLYVGGDFTGVGGQTQDRFAIFPNAG